MSWTAIIGFLLTHQLDFVLSQRGEFYEPVEEGKQPEVLMSNLGLDRNIVRSKVVNVTRDINFFGNTTKTLKVSTLLLIVHSNFAKVEIIRFKFLQTAVRSFEIEFL